MFYLLSGTAEFRCDGQALHAGPGDFVLLPAGLPHAFLVGAGEPLRALQITTPAGSEDFAAGARRTARQRRLPDPAPVDPAALARAAAQPRTARPAPTALQRLKVRGLPRCPFHDRGYFGPNRDQNCPRS
jgi:hypothetical protein